MGNHKTTSGVLCPVLGQPVKKGMDILESNRDHQDGQITRVCDVEDNNERAGFQPAEIKRAEDIVAFFSYVKSRWTQILPGDVQRKDKRQKNKFCLDKIIFHSKSA